MESTKEPILNAPYKVYKRRWFMLGLFAISSATNTMQWVQFSIIGNVIVEYYGVSYENVDWTSMIFLLMYLLFFFLGIYAMKSWGTQKCICLAILFNSIGSWIKVASVSPDRFWVILLGQAVVGSSEVFILSIPSKIAATWFPKNEVSTACGIGVFGVQAGIAVGFAVPPIIVRSKGGVNEIEYGLYTMVIGTAVINTILLIVIFIFFKDKPPTPPSAAQHQINEDSLDFKKSIKSVLTNFPFLLLAFCYGTCNSVFYAVTQLLNQIVLSFYPDATIDAGRIGLLIITSGMIGAVIVGFLLDLFKKFKQTFVVVQVLAMLCVLALTFTITSSISAVYITMAFYGFFVTSIYPAGYELAIELTYPADEGTSAAILNATGEMFGIVTTRLYSYLFNTVGDKTTNLIMCGIHALAIILACFIKLDLRRQAVLKPNVHPTIVTYSP